MVNRAYIYQITTKLFYEIEHPLSLKLGSMFKKITAYPSTHSFCKNLTVNYSCFVCFQSVAPIENGDLALVTFKQVITP